MQKRISLNKSNYLSVHQHMYVCMYVYLKECMSIYARLLAATQRSQAAYFYCRRIQKRVKTQNISDADAVKHNHAV